ncbi:MAG TPA: hypothetical protein VFL17_12990 [Anaerolineae bacterium]|nr:hypothetical protein [Anaerolineae bacterium]
MNADKHGLHRSRWLPLIVLLAILGAGCRSDPNDQFIQGWWTYSDPHLGSIVSEKFQESVWRFDRGTYRFDACCMFEQHTFGKYNIVESEGDVLVLELFWQDGSYRSEPTQIRIVIDRQNDTLKVQRTGPFRRITP